MSGSVYVGLVSTSRNRGKLYFQRETRTNVQGGEHQTSSYTSESTPLSTGNLPPEATTIRAFGSENRPVYPAAGARHSTPQRYNKIEAPSE